MWKERHNQSRVDKQPVARETLDHLPDGGQGGGVVGLGRDLLDELHVPDDALAVDHENRAGERRSSLMSTP